MGTSSRASRRRRVAIDETIRSAIAALGPAPPPPAPTRERSHTGRVSGVTIWTDACKKRLRDAFDIGGPAAVELAFPGWQPHALHAAARRYASAPIGEPVVVDSATFTQRLAAIPPSLLFDRVAELLTWGPAKRFDAPTAQRHP